MLFRQVDLTTALRPCLLPEEALLGVYDSVGLYRDRFKIDTYQDGQLYSTSHRIIYVDNQDARQYSVSIDLKDVDRADLSVRSLMTVTMLANVPGRLLEILAQDHSLSEAAKATIAGVPAYAWTLALMDGSCHPRQAPRHQRSVDLFHLLLLESGPVTL